MRRSLLVALALGLGVATPALAQVKTFLGKSQTRWIDELRDSRSQVRRSAAFALGKLGDDAYLALSPLKQVLIADKDGSVREMAAVALGDIVMQLHAGPKTWEDLGGTLERVLGEDPDLRVRRAAAYALGAFGPLAAPACPALQKALKQEDPALRQNAAWALGRMGPEVAEPAVQDLCQLLKDKDALVRRDAAAALGAIGRPLAKAAARPLLELAGGESEEIVVRKTAVDALVKLVGPEHAEAGAILFPLLESPDPELARGVAFVLSSMGGETALRALPVLRKALDDEDSAVQQLAAAALANLGPSAAPAVADLARALGPTRETEVRRNAAVALALILRTPTEEVARRNPSFLKLIKEHAPEAVPALMHCLKRTEPAEVRQYAAEALAAIRYPANEKALPTLLGVLRSDTDDPLVRLRCVWALFEVRDLKTAGAEKVLREVLTETAPEAVLVRYEAARVLAHGLHENAPDRVTELLLEMLDNKLLKVYVQTDATVSGTGNEATKGQAAVKEKLAGDGRCLAAQALGWLGRKVAKDQKVLDALKEAARDSDSQLKQAAELSLKQLGAATK